MGSFVSPSLFFWEKPAQKRKPSTVFVLAVMSRPPLLLVSFSCFVDEGEDQVNGSVCWLKLRRILLESIWVATVVQLFS